MPTAISKDVLRQFERSEVSYWRSVITEAMKVNSVQVNAIEEGGLFAGAVPSIDILAFNRCLGGGINGPTDEGILKHIINFFRTSGTPRFFFTLFPFADQSHISLLEDAGFVSYNNWIKLYRPADLPYEPTQSNLTFRPATESDKDAYASVIQTAFEWPDKLTDIFGSVIGTSGWKHFVGLERDEVVAVSALYVSGDVASLAMAATLPGHRGKGAQNKMIQLRIDEARRQGCKYLVVETAEQKPDKPVKSFQNLLKQGFEIAYHRPNYIYSFQTKI